MVWADRRPATRPQTRPRRKSWHLRALIPTSTLWVLSFRKGRAQGGWPSLTSASTEEAMKMADNNDGRRPGEDRDTRYRREE